MSEYNTFNLDQFLNNWQSNEKYFEMLSLMASLSRLFSENEIPYLDYRLAENLFCKYYQAVNDARQCTAYDARLFNVGIGIKTFILKNDSSIEKIAEFNKLRPQLVHLKGLDLAKKISYFRNERMRFSDVNFDVKEKQYHIVGRTSGMLRIFNDSYDFINIENIQDVEEDEKTIKFNDEKNYYSFNKSKSVLMKKFSVTEFCRNVPVDIIQDPLSVLEVMLKENTFNYEIRSTRSRLTTNPLVVLPLYSTKNGEVPLKSGLNQWNAAGRTRDINEVYIPVPSKIHKYYPDFFPQNKAPFDLLLPNNNIITSRLCQENNKALMSNPNSDLGYWLLRQILNKPEGEIVTRKDLDIIGIDSVSITKLNKINPVSGNQMYSISFYDNHTKYDDFINTPLE